MATSAEICIKTKDGKLKGVRCNYDGYLYHTGKILLENYNSKTLVTKLISLGDMSALQAKMNKPAGHSFSNPVDGYTIFYGRDRGEDNVSAKKYDNVEDVFSNCSVEYVYVFDTKNNSWYFCKPKGELQSLTKGDVMAKGGKVGSMTKSEFEYAIRMSLEEVANGQIKKVTKSGGEFDVWFSSYVTLSEINEVVSNFNKTMDTNFEVVEGSYSKTSLGNKVTMQKTKNNKMAQGGKVVENGDIQLPAGQYYVGDLCYVLHDEWDEVCDLTIQEQQCINGVFKLKNGTQFALYGTAHGDGGYSDTGGRLYGVDSGTLGCVLVSKIDTKNKSNNLSDGNIINFETSFTTGYMGEDEQEIYFGMVVIDTGYEDDDEDDNDEDDVNEDDYDDYDEDRTYAKGGGVKSNKIDVLKNAIEHLTNNNRGDIEEKYNNSTAYNYKEFCDKCGRGIKGNPAFYIHMVAPGLVVPNDEQNNLEIEKLSIKGELEDMGYYPIGSECVKSYPEEYRYDISKLSTGGGVGEGKKKRLKKIPPNYQRNDLVKSETPLYDYIQMYVLNPGTRFVYPKDGDFENYVYVIEPPYNPLSKLRRTEEYAMGGPVGEYWSEINERTLNENLPYNMRDVNDSPSYFSGNIWIKFKKSPIEMPRYDVKRAISEDFEYYSYGNQKPEKLVSLMDGSWGSFYIHVENLTLTEIYKLLLELPEQVEERLREKNIKGYKNLGLDTYGQTLDLRVTRIFKNGEEYAMGGRLTGQDWLDEIIKTPWGEGRIYEISGSGSNENAKVDVNGKTYIMNMGEIDEQDIVKYATGGGVGNKKFKSEEDGVLGVYSGSEAYSVEISKGDIFETVGKQDSEYWWFVKKVDKTPMRYNMRNQFNERKNKDNVNIDFDELILTFPKGKENGHYAKMKQIMETGGGVERLPRKKFLLYTNPNNSTNRAYVAIGQDVKEVLKDSKEYAGSYTILYQGMGNNEDLQKAKSMYSNYSFGNHEEIMATGGGVDDYTDIDDDDFPMTLQYNVEYFTKDGGHHYEEMALSEASEEAALTVLEDYRGLDVKEIVSIVRTEEDWDKSHSKGGGVKEKIVKDFDEVKPGDIADYLGEEDFVVVTTGYGSEYNKKLKKYDLDGIIQDMKNNATGYGMEDGDFEETPFVVVKVNNSFGIYTYDEAGMLVYEVKQSKLNKLGNVMQQAFSATYAPKETGSASIRIELTNGNVTVLHGSSEEVLLNLQNVPTGTWDKLWDFLKNKLV